MMAEESPEVTRRINELALDRATVCLLDLYPTWDPGEARGIARVVVKAYLGYFDE